MRYVERYLKPGNRILEIGAGTGRYSHALARRGYVASDGCALLLREAIDAMDEESFRLYLNYHFATCEREDLVGITSHALDIFQKS